MSSYYSVYAYRSKFERGRLFETANEARAFDRGFAATALGAMGEADFARALAEGDEKLWQLLHFMRDELPLPAAAA